MNKPTDKMKTPEQIEINGATYVLKTATPADPTGYVLIRSRDSGVHVGKREKIDGNAVTLSDARRIYRWRGARTCSEIALHGIDSAAESGYTRVSEAVPVITVWGACEMIPVTAAALARVVAAGWSE